MLGAIIGDIVGSIYEFNNHRSKDFEFFGPGVNFTDDTVCTIAVADALLHGIHPAEALHDWCGRYPGRGYGGMFRRWLDTSDRRPYGSFGNGAAMRVSPAGIRCLARIFRLAKTLWGYTEYNPCLQVEFNTETPRSVYVTDDMFEKVYGKASPVLQCMMDLAQMVGARRGMILKLTLADMTDKGLMVTLNKRKRTEGVRRQLIRWNDDMRAVIDKALELRAKVRGGQKKVDDLDTAPLFLNRVSKAFSETGFNSAWQRATRAAGFGKHELHFHDLKAKAVSDSPNLDDAMERGGHLDPRTTRRVYRRKPVEVIPLPRVSKKVG